VGLLIGWVNSLEGECIRTAKALRGLLVVVGRGLDIGAGPGEDEKGRVVWRGCFFFFGGGGILVGANVLITFGVVAVVVDGWMRYLKLCDGWRAREDAGYVNKTKRSGRYMHKLYVLCHAGGGRGRT